MALPSIPKMPDDRSIQTGERGFGGRWKKRVFARLVWQGMDPYEAFLKADYPVIGVNSTIGHTQDQARARAIEMASSSWCREWAVSWAVEPKEQVQASVPEAIAVLVDGLQDRTKEGRVSSLAVRCAENLLDRGGIVRSQVIEQGTAGEDTGTRDAKELIRLIKDRLEALEGPVRLPPALQAIVVKKEDDDGR